MSISKALKVVFKKKFFPIAVLPLWKVRQEEKNPAANKVPPIK